MDPAGPKLTGKEEAGEGEFGASVALSEKGEYALIGAPGDNEHVGAAWVFLRTGTTWAQQAEADRKSRGRDRRRRIRQERGAVGQGRRIRADRRAPNDSSGVGAAWVFTAHGHDLDAAGREARREKRRRDRAGAFGYSVAISAKEGNYALIGAFSDNSRRRRGVGVPALGHDLDPAGRETRREKRRRDRRGRIRQERRAAPAKAIRADRRHPTTKKASARRGCSCARARPGPSRARNSSRKAAKRPAPANSATAWRSPPKKATTR